VQVTAGPLITLHASRFTVHASRFTLHGSRFTVHASRFTLHGSRNHLTAGFRNQLDRAALSVSNNIAEGFDRVTTAELLSFLAIARGSASELRSMLSVVKDRPRLRAAAPHLQQIRGMAESCARQISAWAASIENSPIQGKRHLTGPIRRQKQAAESAHNFRMSFLKNLKPEHPLYKSAEAREARGEPSET
jgi:four helix bundle protein